MDSAQLAAVASSHRVYRSFGFVDLCGFTDFAEANGDDIAVLELRRLRSVVREVTPLFGVRVEKWLGDGLMIVGVDNEPVVAAVVAIQQRHQLEGSLAVRAGIAAGEVLLLEGDDYTGRAVNVAARLCDRAGVGQLLAAVEGLRTPSWVRTHEEEPAHLKGLVEPVDAVSLTANLGMLALSRPNPLLSLVEGITRPMRAVRDAGR
ncbi:MAG: adenylate cyclase [Acidimicrobiaceae bacterium]|jgi:class 3 adenylate cyclase|nr:adenylate cyclase [Acidimicrobiaceae bacterium]